MRNLAFGLGVYFVMGIVTAGVVICGGTDVQGSIVLRFDNDIDGGTISYDGSVGGVLTGTDILFDSVTGQGTPLNDGVRLKIEGGKLNFTTGGNLVQGPTEWDFQGGGSVVLTGTVKTDPGDVLVADGTLATGTWTDEPSVLGDSDFLVAVGFGFDTKNTDLLDFFGIGENDFVFATTEISADVDSLIGAAFTATVTEADFVNKLIPEPASLMMWGVLAIAALVYGRRPSRGR